MSDCERIAQVAHDKWVTVSDSLRSLMINEPISDSKIIFFCTFFVRNKNKSNSLIPSFLMSDHARFALVAHQKGANEQIPLFLSKSVICFFFLQTNKRFTQKTYELIPSPGSNHDRLSVIFYTRTFWENAIWEKLESCVKIFILMHFSSKQENVRLNGSNFADSYYSITVLGQCIFDKKLHTCDEHIVFLNKEMLG